MGFVVPPEFAVSVLLACLEQGKGTSPLPAANEHDLIVR